MTPRAVRTAISLDPETLEILDRWVTRRNARSRSDAIRFLVRGHAARTSFGAPDADAVGAVLLLYRHTATNVQRRLTAAQHRWGEHIHSSVHVHLEGDACEEVLILRGRRAELEAAAQDLLGVKGVRDGEFVLLTPRAAGGASGHHHPHAAPTLSRRAPERLKEASS